MQNIKIKNKTKLITYISIILAVILVTTVIVTISLSSSKSKTVSNSTPVATTNNSFILPMTNAKVLKDYSSTELQYNDTLEQWEIHKGIDFVSDSSDVFAVLDGVIENIYTNYLEGTVVVIKHSNNLSTVYKSLSKDVLVEVGDTVKQGDKIGTASNSMAKELNSNTHLHFEVFVNNIAKDPNLYFENAIK